MAERMGGKGSHGAPRVDRRVLRTRQAIKEALLQLVVERDYRTITVTDLTREAGIDRKTFYLHYRAIGDVVDEVFEEEAKHAVAVLREELERGGGPSDIAKLFMCMDRALAPDVAQQRRIVSHVPADGFLAFLEVPLRDALVEHDVLGLAGVDEAHRDYCASFFAAGLAAMYRRWLLSDSELPMEDLAELASRTMTGGVDALTRDDG